MTAPKTLHQFHERRRAWQLLEAAPWAAVREDGFIPDFPPHAALIVPLELWRLRRGELIERPGPLGILLAPEDDVEVIAAEFASFALIAIQLEAPALTQAAALARTLRARGYEGELWSVQALQRNRMSELADGGFDTFALFAQSRQAIAPIDISSMRNEPGQHCAPAVSYFGARAALPVSP